MSSGRGKAAGEEFAGQFPALTSALLLLVAAAVERFLEFFLVLQALADDHGCGAGQVVHCAGLDDGEIERHTALENVFLNLEDLIQVGQVLVAGPARGPAGAPSPGSDACPPWSGREQAG